MYASVVIKDDWYDLVDIKEENKKLIEENKTLKISLIITLRQSRNIPAYKIIL